MHGTTVRIESGLGCPVLEISAQSSLSTNACFTSRYLVFRWQSGQVTRRMDNNVGSVFFGLGTFLNRVWAQYGWVQDCVTFSRVRGTSLQ